MRALFFAGLVLGLLTGCSTAIDARGGSEVCEIHHTFMHSVHVPGPKNIGPITPEYIDARIKGFRHSYPVSIPQRIKTTYLIYLCDECVSAEKEWLHAHPTNQH